MTSPWLPPDSTPVAGPVAVPVAGPDASPPTQPRYGELAPPGYVSPVPPPEYGPPTYYSAPPIVRKSHTADVAVTSVLLALGLVGMLIGLSVGLTLHQSLSSEAARYGVSYNAPGNLGALGAFIVISHVVLFLAALGISLPLLITRRIAFWVPLVAGLLAGIILWTILVSLIVGDSALMNAIGTHH